MKTPSNSTWHWPAEPTKEYYNFLWASKPLAPRRDARSVRNPPAHPKDERRRVRPGPPVILPKIPPCWGTRCPPRQPPGRLVFWLFFRLQIFLPKSCPRPSQGTSQGPQNHPKSDFFLNKSSPGPSSCPFFGGSLFFSRFSSIFGHFSMKKRCEKWCIFSRLRLFFWTCRPLR